MFDMSQNLNRTFIDGYPFLTYSMGVLDKPQCLLLPCFWNFLDERGQKRYII